MEIYDVITLDDEKDYLNIQEIVYENYPYHMFLLLDSEKNPTEDYFIFKRIDLEDGFELEEVAEDLEKKLFPLFQKNYDEE